MGHNDRLLARLSVPVLRAMARRLGVDGADAMDREGLIAALSAEPSRRASAAGRSLRRLVARLPGTVLRAVPGRTPPEPITGPEGGAPKKGEADAGREPGAETDNVTFETVSMADLLIRQGHVDKARAMLRRIVASRPDDGAAREKIDALQAPDQRARPVTRVVEPPAAAGQPPPEAHRQ
ncbi:MAG: hypothetical protein QME96_03740, partial [Myxococcota bacterium]|nr:hypothetical protein [Myxococcota bacterium]